jgi:tetratricopeptide (TPR) repeat protein
MEPGSEQARSLENWIDLCRRVEEDMRLGYDIVLPMITFSDRMSLDLGDMTLELIYFGSTGNKGDTFVMVAEEGLLFLGDVFHAGHSLPDSRGAIGEVDVGRWVESLEYVMARGDDLRHVIRANGEDVWTVERIGEHLELIRGVRQEVESADAAGLSMEETIEAFSPVDEKYPFVRNWSSYEEHGDRILMMDIGSMVRLLWRQAHASAASELARVLEDEGEGAARAAFHEMRSAGNDYYFSEGEFNSKGYEYLGDGRIPEAIAMFKFAVEAFPQSANVYDSLGEGYKAAGRKQLAIENYRKSLELNPENTNAVEMLRELDEM